MFFFCSTVQIALIDTHTYQRSWYYNDSAQIRNILKLVVLSLLYKYALFEFQMINADVCFCTRQINKQSILVNKEEKKKIKRRLTMSRQFDGHDTIGFDTTNWPRLLLRYRVSTRSHCNHKEKLLKTNPMRKSRQSRYNICINRLHNKYRTLRKVCFRWIRVCFPGDMERATKANWLQV